MQTGYTHNIINLSGTKDLVTVMYCSEVFNPEKPDTDFERAWRRGKRDYLQRIW